jgi:hypothetical protein
VPPKRFSESERRPPLSRTLATILIERSTSETLGRRTTHHEQNACSNAHACALPAARVRDVNTCACVAGAASAVAAPAADIAAARNCGSPANPHAAASRNALITEAWSSMGDIAGAQRECALTTGCALAIPRGTRELRKPTRTHGAHFEGLLNPSDKFSPPCRLQPFFTDHLRQNVLVQGQIRDHALEPRVLIPQLANLTQLAHA